jgi:hypothetical protein
LHWFDVVQPQAPDTHAGPGLQLDVQLLHTPLTPHLSFPVPGAQVPFELPLGMEQHPPLHVCDALHAVVHVLVDVLHACPVGQSPAEPHPHLPFDSHAVPAAALVQFAQTVPAAPHAVCELPVAHVPVEPPVIEQQAPLQACEALHVVEHVCELVLQASPTGQSALVLQPQVMFDRHTLPVVPRVQSTHVVPVAPHAVFDVPGWHEPPPQQPEVHVPPEQPTTQRCVVVLHDPVGQSPFPLQPQKPPLGGGTFATHVVPVAFPTQLPQRPPLSPHAVRD